MFIVKVIYKGGAKSIHEFRYKREVEDFINKRSQLPSVENITKSGNDIIWDILAWIFLVMIISSFISYTVLSLLGFG